MSTYPFLHCLINISQVLDTIKGDAQHVLWVCWAVVSREHVQHGIDLVNKAGLLDANCSKVSEEHHHVYFAVCGMLQSKVHVDISANLQSACLCSQSSILAYANIP